MAKIVTFGEIMLRLAPKGYLRFMQEPEFQATFGGGEANVAVSLANYGVDAAFVTKLPENPIGEAAIGELAPSLRKYRENRERRQPGGHLLSGKRSFPAALQGGLRQSAFLYRRG